jgi:hypothetical protein
MTDRKVDAVESQTAMRKRMAILTRTTDGGRVEELLPVRM